MTSDSEVCCSDLVTLVEVKLNGVNESRSKIRQGVLLQEKKVNLIVVDTGSER